MGNWCPKAVSTLHVDIKSWDIIDWLVAQTHTSKQTSSSLVSLLAALIRLFDILIGVQLDVVLSRYFT